MWHGCSPGMKYAPPLLWELCWQSRGRSFGGSPQLEDVWQRHKEVVCEEAEEAAAEDWQEAMHQEEEEMGR